MVSEDEDVACGKYCLIGLGGFGLLLFVVGAGAAPLLVVTGAAGAMMIL